MSTASLSILGCIRAVCSAASTAAASLRRTATTANATTARIEASGAALDCVVNGAIGATCALPLGGRLPTLATALAGVNADQIAGLAYDTATLAAGQTAVTLGAAPASPAHVEATLSGAILAWPTDYTLSGATLTLTAPAAAGDQIAVRRLIL